MDGQHVVQIWDMQPTGRVATSLTIALLILATLALTARFAARLKVGWAFGFDDVFAILGLVFFAAYCGTFIRQIQTSGGTLDRNQFTPTSVVNTLKYVFAEEIIFTFDITCIKLSILFFYKGVFTTPRFVKFTYAAMAVCVAWFITFLFLLIFQCSPIRAIWDVELLATGQAKCVSFGNILKGYEATNIVIDVMILSMPVFVIRSLQLPLRRKLLVSGVFLLGGLVIIICIIRVSYLGAFSLSSPANALPDGLNWSTAELATANICACAPTLGPLFRPPFVPKSLKSWTSWGSFQSLSFRKMSSSSKNAIRSDSEIGEAKRQALPVYDKISHTTQASGDKAARDNGEYGLDEIHIERSVEVV